MKLVRASVNDCDKIWNMQIEAFSYLLKKYEDYGTNPGAETKERIMEKLLEPSTHFYFIFFDKDIVGAVRVVDKKDGSRKRIAPIFIMKEFRGKGLSQKTFDEIEKINEKMDIVYYEKD